MDHRTSEGASAPIGQAAAQGASPDPRPWKIHRNKRGWPIWYQRLVEAWWILTGRWSLHSAWQNGKDHGSAREFQRIIVNGGDLGPLIDSTIYATTSAVLNGSEPSAGLMNDLRRRAWQRYEKDRRGLAQLRAMARQ
jgi:hypothetical protein